MFPRLSGRPGFVYNLSMIRIQLDEPTRERLQALRRQRPPGRGPRPPGDGPPVRRRLARRPHRRPPRLRLPHRPRPPQRLPRPGHRRPLPAAARARPPTPPAATRVAGRLRDLLGQDRTWTAAQLAEALRGRGIALGPRQVRRYLRGLQAGYRRTASTVKHKQDPAKAARAGPSWATSTTEGRGRARWSCTTSTSAASPRRCRLGYSWCPAGAAQAGPVRVPAGPAGQRAGGLPARCGGAPRLDGSRRSSGR